MTDSPQDQMKTCHLCCKEIASAARICPYCLHQQGRVARFFHHPLSAVLFLGFMAPFVAMPLLMFSRMFWAGEPFRDYADQISVVESKIEFGHDEGYWPVVAVVGKIRNSSELDWKHTCVQVEFFDSKGALIDAGQTKEYLSGPRLPAREEVGFKVSFPRYFPESEYASHKVRVVLAIDNRESFFMY
jgi:hypothetical protein